MTQIVDNVDLNATLINVEHFPFFFIFVIRTTILKDDEEIWV